MKEDRVHWERAKWVVGFMELEEVFGENRRTDKYFASKRHNVVFVIEEI